MKRTESENNNGFSLIELMIGMVVMMLALSIVSTILSQAMSVRAREGRTSDALASAQAALGVISREVGNSGFGMYDNQYSRNPENGIVIADSDSDQIRVRANHVNEGGTPSTPGPSTLELNKPGEDITYFFDPGSRSIVRYDPHGRGTNLAQTSVVVNRISSIEFEYFDYSGPNSAPVGPLTAPTSRTGRIRITVTVALDPVVGQPDNQVVTFSSDVTLRNNAYMLQQY